ncbi:MAG: winged helix-turn-helix domain-containing protein, partial [Caldilineaceae bacterium]|nr:winged helix-turn-helix domain-containing protein [Caldilineaceae bacterium]
IASWVHLSMILCAFGSVANIFYSFRVMNHGVVPSAILAVGLGLGLALSAIMASTIPTSQTGRFAFAVCATLAMAAMSGGIQTAGYLSHGIGLNWSLFYGFGVPIATEVLLAIDLSVKHLADRARVLDEADGLLELRINESIADALADLDLSTARRHVEREAVSLIRAKTSVAIARMMPDVVQPVDAEAVQIEPRAVVEMNAAAVQNAEIEPKLNAETDWVDQGNTARSNAKAERMAALIDFYADNPNASQADAADHIGRSKATVNSYLRELEDAGRVFVNGHVEVLR